MFSFKNFVSTSAISLALLGSAMAAPPSLAARQGSATNGWCTGHITQWQRNSEKHGTGGEYEVDLILYDGNGMFINGFNRGRVDGNPGQLKLTALPTPLVMSFGGDDKDPIDMEYNGQTWQCPGEHCKLGGYEDGEREGDFGFTCDNLPQAPE